jgi:hypothetical protein
LDIGFLDHGDERLFRRPARFEKGREITALPELGDLRWMVRTSLRSPKPAPKAFDLEIQQPLCGKADHGALAVAIRALLNQLPKVDQGDGRRVGLQGCRV